MLGGSIFPEGFCQSHPGQLEDCVHTPNCSVRALWGRVEGVVRQVLERVTLQDLLVDESHLRDSLMLPLVPAAEDAR